MRCHRGPFQMPRRGLSADGDGTVAGTSCSLGAVRLRIAWKPDCRSDSSGAGWVRSGVAAGRAHAEARQVVLPAHAMDVGVVGNRGSVACDLMLPVKLMEYVSLGIPTVAPRLRTIQHYFSEDTVAFYEVENVESMADAIFSLYATPELRSRQVALAREFLRKYGWQSQGAELIDLYREIMEN